MSRCVLLVDADVDALGELASALRARGIRVVNASDAHEAIEQAFRTRPDVILVDWHLDEEQDFSRHVDAVPELGHIPVLRLVSSGSARELGIRDVPRTEVEVLVSRIVEVSPRDSRRPLEHELRGHVEQTPLADVIQLLSMNRRSGVLSIITASGSGEVHLAYGEVVDAVYRRFDGEKALYRILGERVGRFAFSPGEPSSRRRLTAPTSHLLLEAMRQLDDVQRCRASLSPGGEALRLQDRSVPLISSVAGLSSRSHMSAVVQALILQLQVPRGLDELLDALPYLDLEILEGLVALDAEGRLRRIPLVELTTPFAPSEQLPVLRSLVSRLTRPGFAPPPRLFLATGAQRMSALARAVRSITDTVVPSEQPSNVALPQPLGILRLGDDIELSLVGLPADDQLAPCWALALPGAVAVVRLSDARHPALEAYCEALDVLLLDAESILGAIDIAVAGQLAALVRSSIELAAGV